MRERALAEKRPPRYEGFWREREPGPAQLSMPFAIRLKAPRDGASVVADEVQGEVTVANTELDDMIILRSDGTPTYLHAVVVDDHDMAITHVIRGDDHLTNTFRQCMVYDAMGWQRPRFGHIPLIHGADGAKLSKRHGAVSVLDLREQGLLPEAVCNYLLRLGWGHGDEEIISRARAEAIFDLKDVGRAASRMDYAKLAHVNGVYLRQADPGALLPDVLRRLGATVHAARVEILLPALQERAKNLAELAASAAFAVTAGAPAPDAKSAALLTPDARMLLVELATFLSAAVWERAGLEQALRDYAEVKQVKLKDIAQPLRVALTGSTMSPPIDLTLFALGKPEALARISAAAGAKP